MKIGRIDSRLIILGGESCESPPDNINDEGQGNGDEGQGNDDDDDDDEGELTDTVDLKDQWIVKGIVKDAKTGEALNGLTISLFDKDLFFDDLFGNYHYR